jgi:hypothetical protein
VGTEVAAAHNLKGVVLMIPTRVSQIPPNVIYLLGQYEKDLASNDHANHGHAIVEALKDVEITRMEYNIIGAVLNEYFWQKVYEVAIIIDTCDCVNANTEETDCKNVADEVCVAVRAFMGHPSGLIVDCTMTEHDNMLYVATKEGKWYTVTIASE